MLVSGSLGIGNDMSNNYNFGYNTFVLSENNLRILFDDTSVGTFPSNDWMLEANGSGTSGSNYFTIKDVTKGTNPFVVEAGAYSNALVVGAGAKTNSIYIKNTGRVGFGTSSPIKDLHVVCGNTPTIRLEQDLTQGWSDHVQSWDVGGHEGLFFVREATNGNTYPLQIKNGAPTSSIYVNSNGFVGMGNASPKAKLQVSGSIKVDSVMHFNPIDTAGIALLEGTMLMDSENHVMMYNNGDEWVSLVDKQEISLLNDTLSISGSNTKVNLDNYLDNTDNQQITLSNNTLSIDDGNSVSLSKYINTDKQSISFSENTISISGSEPSVDLSQYLDNTDVQEISISDNILNISGSETSVDLSEYLDNTDVQEISISDNTLNISGSETSVDLSEYRDNTDAQEISFSENTLSISGSETSTDLSGLLDNTDEQILALNGNTLSISDGNSVDLSSLLEEQQSNILELNMQVEDLTQEVSDLKELMEIVAEAVGAKVMAKACSIDQNIPNPFSTSTVIPFEITEYIKNAYIAFYSQRGQLIEKVELNERGIGSYTFTRDSSSQVYFYALIVDGVKVESKKMISVR